MGHSKTIAPSFCPDKIIFFPDKMFFVSGKIYFVPDKTFFVPDKKFGRKLKMYILVVKRMENDSLAKKIVSDPKKSFSIHFTSKNVHF